MPSQNTPPAPLPEPTQGGSYTRHPDTGALTPDAPQTPQPQPEA